MYWLTTLVKKDFLLFLIFTYIYILVLNCPTLHTINIIVDCRLFLMASRSNNCFYHLSLNGFRTWLVSGHKFGLTIYNGTDSIGGRMWPNNKHTLEARSGEGNGTPLQYSGLENPMDERAWWAAVHGVAKSQTRLSSFTFTFHFHASEKEMATHFSVLAWRIPGTGEPGGLLSMGSHRVRHDWRDLAAAAEARRALIAGLFSGQVSVSKQSVSLIFMALGPMDLHGSEDRIHGLYLSASADISVCRLSSI